MGEAGLHGAARLLEEMNGDDQPGWKGEVIVACVAVLAVSVVLCWLCICLCGKNLEEGKIRPDFNAIATKLVEAGARKKKAREGQSDGKKGGGGRGGGGGRAREPVQVGAITQGKGTTKLKSKLKRQPERARAKRQVGAAPTPQSTQAQIKSAALARV